MRVFLQIDPPERLNPRTDSTIALALEAQQRGHEVFYYTPRDLSADRGEIVAAARAVTFLDQETDFFRAGETHRLPLESEADIVLVRQDPPFDMAYLTTTWLLSMLRRARVVNAAQALRDRPEKLLPLHFPQFCPPTLISADVTALMDFQKEMGEVVLKPLYGHGGHGVFHIGRDGNNLGALLETFFARSPEPLVLQRFLPDVVKEEKRILLINGEFAGAFGRLPVKGEIRSNMRVGGQPVKTELTQREREVCEALGPFCRREGILLAGVDMIGDWLVEVNITSPTGIKTVQQLYGTNPAAMFWNALSSD